LLTTDFDYELPPELIAQTPLEPRDASRMLVLDRASGAVTHRAFRNLGRYLVAGDVLVLNRTRVLPARLEARKLPSGGRVELLLVRRFGDGTWESLVRGRRVPLGTTLQVGSDGPTAAVLDITPAGGRRLQFDQPPELWLHRYGAMPLPPYIHRRLEDPERYQTVYSSDAGSAAAPTAGLHFTTEYLDQLREGGVDIEYVTLHVGLDTFRPVAEDDPATHAIHTEWCQVPSDVADRISRAKADGRRIVAVGTTAVRTLETAAAAAKEQGTSSVLIPYSGDTSLFILPGHQFRAVDALLTNFHLPRSTLLLLVSAFAGRERILAAYREAVEQRYRFFSFGDCMLIL